MNRDILDYIELIIKKGSAITLGTLTVCVPLTRFYNVSRAKKCWLGLFCTKLEKKWLTAFLKSLKKDQISKSPLF